MHQSQCRKHPATNPNAEKPSGDLQPQQLRAEDTSPPAVLRMPPMLPPHATTPSNRNRSRLANPIVNALQGKIGIVTESEVYVIAACIMYVQWNGSVG